jgi:tetratricopeptide (TPR) repeat protein
MARADRRRSQRAKPAAVTRRSDVVIEDTMFFPRLRRHARWMFVFLALVFGVGFVGFGVGAGGIGFGDVLRGSGGSGGPSAEDAQKRIDENPKDVQAFRDLATALQADGDTDGAIQALSDLTALRPRDLAALRELAALYLAKSDDAQQRAQISQLRSDYLAPGGVVIGSISLGGKPLDVDPINQANAAYSEAQSASQSAVDTYKKIAAATPRDPTVQLELAQTAQNASDYATAVAAYKKFLKLAPDDPSAPDVKRLLKQLEAFAG